MKVGVIVNVWTSVADWVWFQNYQWHRWRQRRAVVALMQHENILRGMTGARRHAVAASIEFDDCTNPRCRR